jgi:predicted transposase/invertase (TIGR01784 family)
MLRDQAAKSKCPARTILTFIYLEMPTFTKTEAECQTVFDKWLYALRNLQRLDRIPDRFRERIFKKLFAAAEIARFTPEEARTYEDSLKVYRDLKNSFDTAFEDGKIEGKAEVADRLLARGNSPEEVAELTGLPLAEIRARQARPRLVREPAARYKTPAKPPPRALTGRSNRPPQPPQPRRRAPAPKPR